jgi:SAM-dependent methyltransferase
MTPRTGGPPYFDRLLQRLATADPGAGAAFGRHVHWGYWSEPAQAGVGVEEYGRAAEALCLAVLNSTDVRDGLRILDVGCGFGGTIACLNERYSRMELLGVNIDPPQLQRAAAQIELRSGNALGLLLADAAQLPIADECVDVALAVESVFHFDRPRFFAEMGRTLRSGGSLTLSDFVPHARAAPYIEAMDFGGNDAVCSTYGVIDVSWSLDRYRLLAATHGLTLSDVRDVTAHTLPTYDFLSSNVERWTDTLDAEQFIQATGLLEKASRRGFISYQILRFDKR